MVEVNIPMLERLRTSSLVPYLPYMKDALLMGGSAKRQMYLNILICRAEGRYDDVPRERERQKILSADQG